MSIPEFIRNAEIEVSTAGDVVIDTVSYDSTQVPEDATVVVRKQTKLDGAYKRPNLTAENYHLAEIAQRMVSDKLANKELDPTVDRRLHLHNTLTQLIFEFENKKKASRPMNSMENLLNGGQVPQQSQTFQPQIAPPPQYGPHTTTVAIDPHASGAMHQYPPNQFTPNQQHYPPHYPQPSNHPGYQQPQYYQPPQPQPQYYQPPQPQYQPREVGRVIRHSPQPSQVVHGKVVDPPRTIYVQITSSQFSVQFETHWQMGVTDEAGNTYVMILVIDESVATLSSDVIDAIRSLDGNYSITTSESPDNVVSGPKLNCVGPSLVYRFEGRLHLIVPLGN